MKRTLLFITCVLASITMQAQEDPNDYIPFVEKGKQWHVVSYVPADTPNYRLTTYRMNEEEEHDGKTYFRVQYSYKDAYNEAYSDVYNYQLFREENRRVYIYYEWLKKEIMMYDFTLKEGDTFYYEFNNENCKVLKQGWLEDGPQIVSSYILTPADTLDIKHRRLRTWTIGREIGSGQYHEFLTWVEGAGTLDTMFCPDCNGTIPCLAYIERTDGRTGYWENEYLPFSFYNMYGQVHGCDLPKTASYISEDWHSHLTYELEGDRLHVNGQLVLNCGGYNYAYFFEEPTDDPLVHKLHFEIQNVGEEATCVSLFATDFYVPGFDPNMNYIVIDSDGEEHPVINKTPQMAYRPFVEEGKVWQVGAEGSGNPVQIVEYYYFDGDTIIDGKACKQMMCQWYVSPNHPYYGEMSQLPSLSYEGAWYEENKKVYTYDVTNKQFILMYDFSADANDTIQINNCQFVIGPKQTGGIKGFKGVYQDVRRCENGGSSYSPTWMEGVGSIDGPTKNVHYVDEVPTWFLMACAVDDEVIYLNDEYEDGATPENMGAQKRRFDFTHTVKTQPKNPRRREAEQSLYGEYNDKLLGINLDPVDDAYLVRITDETGKVVYEKAIDAGNIVALNVDISSYAIGRYTVTVENSQESFTGEFETQTTGIEEICSKRSEVRDYIYNLQGQRLTSLQKGLNIVNGKKVYVK